LLKFKSFFKFLTEPRISLRGIFLSCLFCSSLFSESFVTYEFSGGRFGDCLLTYLHAKWLSYTYQIPILYKPFPYSSKLALHTKEKFYHPIYLIKYSFMKLNQYLPFSNLDGYVYECPYFPMRLDPEGEAPESLCFQIDRKDRRFKKIAREMISPLQSLDLIKPSENFINVAIHIRTGGGYDDTLHLDPLKFPPLSFYLEGFLKVLELFEGIPIYCHLFTDDLEPSKLAAELEKRIPLGAFVQINYRKNNNHHAVNVLEDFFSFFHFDVLIYPHSNYSAVAAMIGDFAITYFPLNFFLQGKNATITKSCLDKDEVCYQQVIKRCLKER
jgi:hypothetical protein